MLSDIRNEECPKCHEKGALFVCSMGSVNCSNCCEYIRPLTADEWDERQEAIKAIMPKLTNRTPLAESLHTIRCTAQITLREMSKAIGVDVSVISGWEHGRTEPDIRQIEAYLKACVQKSKIE
jgi:DNA-binding transcriptional regulator YiaG